MRLTDTHCHLDLDRFGDDRQEVIGRAQMAGIEKMLVPAIHLESARRIVQLAAEYPAVYGAVGVHPNDATSWNMGSASELIRLVEEDRARHGAPKIVAIGEIGLDHYWKDVPPATQESALREQLGLAARLGLPVIVHMREHADASEGSCSATLLPIIREWVEGLMHDGSEIALRPGVFHSFSGSTLVAQQALDLGFYIGVTGPVTYKSAEQKVEVVKSIPLDRILIETDSPFLAPVPFRGKRNEPAYVQYVANAIATIFGINPQEAATITAKNAARLFAWEEDL